MRYIGVLLVISTLAGCRPASPTIDPAPVHVPADLLYVVADADRRSMLELWPGFDARTVAVAAFDGERTLLFRHPKPPSGFERLPGQDELWVFAGRFPGVTANSSADIGGILTATLIPAGRDASVAERAGLLLHEAFHVFQRTHHPSWSANEAELFTYPVNNPRLLTLRRIETAALRRALASEAPAQSSCWARTALSARQERFAGMPSDAADYERATELNEGLANYVERRAGGLPDSTIIPKIGFAPESFRQRSYSTGAALGRLLDRFHPAWRESLERDDSTALGALLWKALTPTAAPTCDFTAAERSHFQSAAVGDLKALRERLAEQRSAFLQQPGWKLIITASDVPLFPQGFDPLNVQITGPSEVLHTRWLKLGNELGVMEVLQHTALTKAAGDHPLFNGVRTVIIPGIVLEPTIAEEDGFMRVEATGISASFRGATVQRKGHHPPASGAPYY